MRILQILKMMIWLLAIIQVALQKGIPEHRIENIKILISFLKNIYTKHGIGEGSSEYHNLHHSLEVAYISLQMLPKEFHGHSFNSKDYEIILVEHFCMTMTLTKYTLIWKTTKPNSQRALKSRELLMRYIKQEFMTHVLQ